MRDAPFLIRQAWICVGSKYSSIDLVFCNFFGIFHLINDLFGKNMCDFDMVRILPLASVVIFFIKKISAFLHE